MATLAISPTQAWRMDAGCPGTKLPRKLAADAMPEANPPKILMMFISFASCQLTVSEFGRVCVRNVSDFLESCDLRIHGLRHTKKAAMNTSYTYVVLTNQISLDKPS